MPEENRSDIHVGETERIHWVKLDTSSIDLIDVDYIVAKHNDFWTFLEIFCVPDCCGLDAFRFYRDDIKNAAGHVDKELLKSDLSKLKNDLLSSDKDIIISSRLNNLVDKAVFFALNRPYCKQLIMEDKKQKRLKTGAKIVLIILLLNMIGQLAAIYQTRYQLISPLIPESTIWEINKQFVFHAIVSATASIVGLLLYFVGKYLLIIILVAVVLLANRFIYV